MERTYRNKENTEKIKTEIWKYLESNNAKKIDKLSHSEAGGYISNNLEVYSIESPFVVALKSEGNMAELGHYLNFTFIGEGKNINELEKIVGVKPEEN